MAREFDPSRFWSKVTIGKADECWPWKARANKAGYGRFWYQDKYQQAHRVSWELTYGPLPPRNGWHGTVVRHKCDNRLCQNPSHLETGTQGENMKDMWDRGRRPRTWKQRSKDEG